MASEAPNTASRAGLATDPLLENVPTREGYKVLGGVVLYQKLGQGGMGAVYRGHHLRLDIDVALKVMALPPEMSPEAARSSVQRFLREARTAAAIKHQNLIRVYDVDTEYGVHYLVMDYVDGESAADRLERKGRISETEAAEICLGAAEGLAAAHRKGIVHRDVKPDNILIDKQGEVVVADLGLAKAFLGEDSGPSMLTQTQAGMGTPFYMAPEQFTSARDVGPAADAWSLGVTLFQLLTGEVPWTDTSVFALADKIRGTPFPDPKKLCPDLSDGVCQIVEKALQKNPAERYTDCSETAESLRAHLDSVRGPEKSALPDVKAGSTKLAPVSVTPPRAGTLTLIAEAETGKMPVPAPGLPQGAPGAVEARTPQTIRIGRPVGRGWILPVAISGGGALLLALLLVFLLGRSPADRGSGTDGTEQLGSDAAAPVEQKEGEEETARKHAAFEAAISAADEAEKAGDLDAAALRLRAALDEQDAPSVRERLTALEKALAAGRLLAEAARHEKMEEWGNARTKYEKALKDAKGEEKRQARRRLTEVERRIKIEETVAAIQRAVDASAWREAWKHISEAKAAGISDPRLEEFLRRAVKAIAPLKSLTGPLGIELVLVQGGTFKMGSGSGSDSERPVHEVTLSSLYVSRYEVTQAQFEAFRRGLRSAPRTSTKTGKLPVVSISWQAAVDFCKRLSDIDGSGAAYRLPTEAEWEYVARGREGREYPWGDDPPRAEHANVAGRDDGFMALAPVGSCPKGATPLGILDMAGNAAEWCSDWYGPYPSGRQTNPSGPTRGKARVVRGGAYHFEASWTRAAHRAGRRPDHPGDFIGFRVVRELTAEETFFHREAQDHE